MKASDTIRALLKISGKKQADLVQPLGMGSAASLNNKFSGNRWDADDLIIVGRETNSKPGFLLSDGQFVGYDEAKERKKEGRSRCQT